MTTDTMVTTQVYRVYVKAAPQAIWDAITKPEWTGRYGYGGRGVYDLRFGGAYRGFASEAMKAVGAARGMDVPDVAVDGEVIEIDPPRKLRADLAHGHGPRHGCGRIHAPDLRDRRGRWRRHEADGDP